MLQPAAPVPPTPPTPPTPPSPSALPTAVQIPGATPGAAPVELALPRTAAQVRGLRERREILRDQLERATNRRENIVEEMRTARAEELAGLQQRLRVVDERILQLEQDQAATERQLSNAPPEVLAAAAERPHRERDMVPQDDAFGFMTLTFGLGALVTYAVGRLRRRRGGAAVEAARRQATSPDPRLDQLSHAVDAIAVEVERIGEGQRFVTQLLAEQRPSLARDAGAPAGRMKP